MPERQVPGCEKVDHQRHGRGHRKRHDRPCGENTEVVHEPQEQTEIEQRANTVDDDISAQLVNGLCIPAGTERVLPIQVPGDGNGRRKRIVASMQQTEVVQVVQQRENSTVDDEANGADNDESTGLMSDKYRHPSCRGNPRRLWPSQVSAR